MKELQDILRLVRDAPGPLALATLVRTEGASYRKPGARLLMNSQGLLRGSLSGGCLEADLQARAQEVLASKCPRLLAYDLRGEADLVWGSGSGCEGMLHILLESLPDRLPWMDWIEQAWVARTPLSLHTDLTAERLGQRTLQAPPGLGEVGFVERIDPPVALWIFGASDDSHPLARMAKELGWFVGVLDHRPAFARPERFPEADVVRSGHPAQILADLALDARSAIVLMTHHYAKDLEALRLLLPSAAGYLGLMGSRARGAKLLGVLAEEGLQADDRLRTPVGLDLGARAPESIALAILAEIHATFAGRSGQPLRQVDAEGVP